MAATPVSFPLKFDTIEQEVNLLSLHCLLDFGHSFNSPMLKAKNRSISDCLLWGMMSLHIAGTSITSKYMQEISLKEVSSIFDIPLMEEVPHPTMGPVVMMGQDTELKTFAIMVQNVLNETGHILVNGGYPNLARFVLESAKPGKGVEEFMVALIKAFPTFKDNEIISNSGIVKI